jgi:hypothetical protein
MGPIVDIFFGVRGSCVSADHGYALYGAVTRVLEAREDAWFHRLDHLKTAKALGLNISDNLLTLADEVIE